MTVDFLPQVSPKLLVTWSSKIVVSSDSSIPLPLSPGSFESSGSSSPISIVWSLSVLLDRLSSPTRRFYVDVFSTTVFHVTAHLIFVILQYILPLLFIHDDVQ